MSKISIDVSKDELKILKKRADKNFLTLKEQAEDIIRRSLISYKKRQSSGLRTTKVDDKLVAAFSRDRRGRKRKSR